MKSEEFKILIAGAGIGGLTAAIALKQAGFGVHVFERAREIRAIGAGISIQMNAMAAIDRLGLSQPIRDAGNVIKMAKLVRPDKSPISKVPFHRISESTGFPFVSIHRGKLQEILLDVLGEDRVSTGWEVDEIQQSNGHVQIRFPNGEFEQGDLLIGADGINSKVREYLHGSGEKRYTGYTAWRGICPNPDATPRDTFYEIWGNRQVFGFVPVDDQLVYWFATKYAPPGESDNGDAKEEVLKRFGQYFEPVPALIESTPPEFLIRNDIYDRKPLKSWSRQHVTLLGDAAHPMTPNLGQGGCQAIEDAIILAELLRQHPGDVPHALQLYESKRRRRTKEFVKLSRIFTSLSHGHPWWAQLARSTVFRWMPDAIKLAQMKKLYRFEI